MKKISISIVLHNTNLSTAENVIKSCLQDVSFKDIFIIDNSKNNYLSVLEKILSVNYKKIHNRGFGSAHNIAYKSYNLNKKYKYHLIINPDVEFKKPSGYKNVNTSSFKK